jgi:hypothetical protein
MNSTQNKCAHCNGSLSKNQRKKGPGKGFCEPCRDKPKAVSWRAYVPGVTGLTNKNDWNRSYSTVLYHFNMKTGLLG